MFICAVTGKVSQPREPQIRVVVSTRRVQYVNEVPNPDDKNYGTMTKTTYGTEIVKEIAVTKEGYDLLVKQGMVTP